MNLQKAETNRLTLQEEIEESSPISYTRGRVEKILGTPISHEECRSTLQKGQKVENTPSNTFILDAGAYDDFLKKVDESSLNDKTIPKLYRDSIANGVIDHHVIDSILSRNGFTGQKYERCSAQIAVDFEGEIKRAIDEIGVTKIDTHTNMDLDAISSSYLVKALIQTGQLPAIGAELAQIANQLDYGRFSMDPKNFIDSVAGVFEAIKIVMEQRAKKEQGARVFSNPEMMTGRRMNQQGFALFTEIRKKYEDETGKRFFDVLNAANRLKLMGKNFSLAVGFKARIKDSIDADTAQIIEEGGIENLKAHEQFAEDFKTANTREIKVDNRDEKKVPANLLIAKSEQPLLFTNMSYLRTPPNTIIAVYAGKDAKGGDRYDIGIQAEQADAINLGKLCVALNKAEKIKRDVVYAKPESVRTTEEKELIQKWENEQDRIGMSGPEQVLTKDPTVLVAGGTLIAASRTSLLDFEEFQAAINSVF